MAGRIQPLESHSYLVGGIDGPDGADRMYVTAGSVQSGEMGDFFALIEPRLEPGQFRRAFATAAISGFNVRIQPPPDGIIAKLLVGYWYVSDVDADWDDESGYVQLRYRIAGQHETTDPWSDVRLERIAFEVTTFAGPATSE